MLSTGMGRSSPAKNFIGLRRSFPFFAADARLQIRIHPGRQVAGQRIEVAGINHRDLASDVRPRLPRQPTNPTRFNFIGFPQMPLFS